MFIMQAIIFRIVPTALEISLVCGILVRLARFSPWVGLTRMIDIQVRLGLCCDHGYNFSGVYVVHGAHYILAV